MSNHYGFINDLSRELRPVRPVAPVWQRAIGWGLLALAAGFLSTRLLHREATDWTDEHVLLSALNAGLSITLGLTALGAAMSISIAGRRLAAKGWCAAGLAAWLIVSLASTTLSLKPLGSVAGEGSYCYTFVVAAGLPMIAVVVAALRRTGSLTPRRTLALAGSGIAFLAFGLLAFCHSAEMSLIDLGMHILAAVTLGAVTVLFGHRAVKA